MLKFLGIFGIVIVTFTLGALCATGGVVLSERTVLTLLWFLAGAMSSAATWICNAPDTRHQTPKGFSHHERISITMVPSIICLVIYIAVRLIALAPARA